MLNTWTSAVNGHFDHPHQRPWARLDEFVNASSARLVGAKPEEVIIMNTLTVNLHILLVTFYTPTAARYKVIMEEKAFPSDHVRGDRLSLAAGQAGANLRTLYAAARDGAAVRDRVRGAQPWLQAR